jgi:hypothetical protein
VAWPAALEAGFPFCSFDCAAMISRQCQPNGVWALIRSPRARFTFNRVGAFEHALGRSRDGPFSFAFILDFFSSTCDDPGKLLQSFAQCRDG